VTWTDHLRMIGSFVVIPSADETMNVSALTTANRGFLWVDAKWMR
jgi:hypothetical protein